MKKHVATTRGGGHSRLFAWWLVDCNVTIESESGMSHEFGLQEIYSVLCDLHQYFGKDWFPLANNVEKLYDETEANGLGSIIYSRCPGDTKHAQGASYLGVVLEQAGILEWNAQVRGIKWKIVKIPTNVAELGTLLWSAD
jgi:hypothetical protein